MDKEEIENEQIKAQRIFAQNEAIMKEKAELVDVLDNSMDIFLEKIKLKKEAGCKLQNCKIVDNNIKLRIENIKLKKYIEQLENKEQEYCKKIEELENVLDKRFIYIIGARTVYAMLMCLDKEIIIRDNLELRNKLNQVIKYLKNVD